MRLLIVSNTYPPADISGVASLVYEMAHQFGSAGHFARVLVRRVDEPDPYAIGVGGSKLTYPLRAAWRYLRLAPSERYDLVHVHESDGIFVVLLFSLARFLGFPWAQGKLVATLQVSYDEERRQVRPVLANGVVVAEPTDEERSFARWRARLHGMFGRWTVRLADRVVAPSKVTAKELEQDYGARDVEVIYNGIAVDDQVARAAETLEARLSDGEPTEIVIYAGRMRTRKAVAVLLKAFQQVLVERPRAELILIGAGEQYDALREYHRQLELGDRVRFLGGKPRSEVFDGYAQADVYCLPSRYEGFPVATLEAMAVGLPVVLTTVSGNPEAVEDGISGRLVEPEDAQGLAEALIELLEDPDKRRRMGREAQKRVRDAFAIGTIAADYLELWQNLTSEHTSPSHKPTESP